MALCRDRFCRGIPNVGVRRVFEARTEENDNEKELQRMPNTDINKIANMVPGVSSRAGETPSIKGASPSGTAYFVDGVRIYGALPMLVK